MHSLLDVAKIADSLVFVLESTEGWDSYGEYCLSCLFAQGLPSHGEIWLETINNTVYQSFCSNIWCECQIVTNSSSSLPYSTGMSGTGWSSGEETCRVSESTLSFGRISFPRSASLPCGQRAGCHAIAEASVRTETEAAGLPLSPLTPAGSESHICTKHQPEWDRRPNHRVRNPLCVRIYSRLSSASKQASAYHRSWRLSAQPDRCSCRPSTHCDSSPSPSEARTRRRDDG